MKIFKLEVLIMDEDVYDIEMAKSLIDNTRYPNHAAVSAITCREADIGDWDDDGPLNGSDDQRLSEMKRLFPLEEDK